MDGFTPTNTMANTAFDVLTMDGIDDPLINVNNLGTLDLDESYFAAAVAFVNETNREMMENKQNLYRSISEATTQFVILESFSDFFSKIADIINKILLNFQFQQIKLYNDVVFHGKLLKFLIKLTPWFKAKYLLYFFYKFIPLRTSFLSYKQWSWI